MGGVSAAGTVCAVGPLVKLVAARTRHDQAHLHLRGLANVHTYARNLYVEEKQKRNKKA